MRVFRFSRFFYFEQLIFRNNCRLPIADCCLPRSFAPYLKMKQSITGLLNFFYPPFKRIMPVQTFRYAACGGANATLGLCIYWVSLHFIFEQKIFDFGISAFKPHNAALFFSSGISFIIGFLLNKYVVFVSSNLKGRIQFFRYFLAFFFNLVMNYFILKLFVEVFLWAPFISQLLTISILIVISYLTQKHFSFRTKKDITNETISKE